MNGQSSNSEVKYHSSKAAYNFTPTKIHQNLSKKQADEEVSPQQRFKSYHEEELSKSLFKANEGIKAKLFSRF